MSEFSGKCDLRDHIEGLGGRFDKDGNPVKMGEASVYYSDEMLDYEEFKKRSGGVIHQRKRVQVSDWNQEDVKKHCPGFDYFKHTKQIPDKRCKKGYREEHYYTYKYLGKEYGSLKDLNENGVYVTTDIRFDSLLELIPYYPYVISFCYSDKDKDYVVIGDKPYPIEQMEERMEHGGLIGNGFGFYYKDLIAHFKEVVLKYYNPDKK